MLSSSVTSLPKMNIHVWHAMLSATTLKFAKSALDTLSVEELKKLNGFLNSEDRHLYCLAHTMLRCILAKYLNRSSYQIKLKHNSYGKPYLLDDEFYFNMSHTKNHIVIAISHSEIGVDIEFKRILNDLENIAKHIFTNEELQILQNKSSEELHNIFYDLWTRKEALVKGVGSGLSIAKNCDIRSDVQKIAHSFTDELMTWRIEKLLLPYSHCSASIAYLTDSTVRERKKIYFKFDSYKII